MSAGTRGEGWAARREVEREWKVERTVGGGAGAAVVYIGIGRRRRLEETRPSG